VLESRAPRDHTKELAQEQEREQEHERDNRKRKENNKRERDNKRKRITVQCPPHVGWSIYDGFGEGNEGLHG
jgi:hypothetical protein